MKSIREINSTSLKWARKGLFPPTYHLLSDGDLIAILRFENNTRVAVESMDGNWTMNRHGLIRIKFVVRSKPTKSDIAKLDMNWRGTGILDFPQYGEKLLWTQKGYWNPTYSFVKTNGDRLVSFKAKIISMACSVEIDNQALSSPHLQLLVALGGYIVILVRKQFGSTGTPT